LIINIYIDRGLLTASLPIKERRILTSAESLPGKERRIFASHIVYAIFRIPLSSSTHQRFFLPEKERSILTVAKENTNDEIEEQMSSQII
jgi:hypothetical protein